MIIGTGIDITEILRIEKLLKKGVFIKRFFSEKEEAYFIKRKNAPQTVAGAYSAKEAFAKALGTGVRGFSLKDVEVLHDELGKPYLSLSKEAEKTAKKMGIKKLFLSISHSEEYAVASVIAEGDED